MATDSDSSSEERFRAAGDDLRRNEAEEALREARRLAERQRRLYEAILDNTPDLAYVFDLDHRFIYANQGLLRMWGRTWEEAIGRNCLELGYEPWHAALHDREIEQVIATGRPIRGEVPFSGTFGRRIYDYIFVPVFGPGGSVEAVAGTTRDVTDYREDEKRKDEFVATLSHELRNPLAPLRNAVQLMRLGAVEDREALEEMMERQVSHLVRLVDDLLEVSRITRGTLELRRERIDLGSVARTALETSLPLLREAGQQVAVSLPGEPVWVDADPVRLAQVVTNLLNNAAAYTDQGARIALEARREGDRALLRVRDDGIGIARERLSAIFEMFTRGEQAEARAPRGLGIGLGLARRLTEMHGGTLEAKSEGPGRGSEFTVRLPLAPARAQRAALAEAQRPVAGQRVLVVDDNRDAAESLAMILQTLGAEVRVATSGLEGLDECGRYAPAVVVLDIGMPGMDGYEVARRIRARPAGRPPALVALTGWGQEDYRLKARDAGFDHYLVKPADIAALRSLLASLAR